MHDSIASGVLCNRNQYVTSLLDKLEFPIFNILLNSFSLNNSTVMNTLSHENNNQVFLHNTTSSVLKVLRANH